MSLVLAAEIVGSIIGALLVIPGMMVTIRAIVAPRHQAPFNSAADVAVAMARAAKEGWAHRSLCAFDIAFNVIVLRGQQDETISTHSWRAAQEGKLWGKVMCGWLNWFQPNHGPKAASGDLERATVRVAVLKK